MSSHTAIAFFDTTATRPQRRRPLGQLKEVGTIAVGKRAGLLLAAGNPAATIGEIAKRACVSSGGLSFDSAEPLPSAKGAVGR